VLVSALEVWEGHQLLCKPKAQNEFTSTCTHYLALSAWCPPHRLELELELELELAAVAAAGPTSH